MESLSILCTTCGSRLRVRDPRLVGQIVACPKCQAMVLVSAEGESGFAVGQGEIDSEALTQDRIEASEGWEAAPADSAGQSSGAKTGGGWLEDQEEMNAFGAASSSEGRPGAESSHLPPESGLPPGAATHLDGAVPPVAWQSESSAKVRQLAAVAAIAVIGLLIAGGVFMLVIRSWKDSRSPQKTILAEVDGASGDLDTAGDGRGLGARADNSPPGIPVIPESASDATTDDTSSNEIPDAGMGKPTAEDPSEHVGDDDQVAGVIESGQKEGDGAGGVTLPEPLFPEVVAGIEDRGNESDQEGTAEELPPSLAQYMEVIQLGKPDANVIGTTAPAPPAIDQLRIQFPQMLAPDTEFPPPAAPVDVRARGKMRIMGFIAEDQPLDRVLRVVGQAAGIPVEMNLLAFDVAGMQVNQLVAIKSKETEAAPLLAAIVQIAGCVMQLGDDSIVRVSPNESAIEQAVSRSLKLDDFDGQLPLAESEFRKLTGADEASVLTVQAGVATLESTQEIRLRAALLLDAIRSARGLAGRLDSSGAGRWIRTLADGVGGNDRNRADWGPIADHEVGFSEDQEYGIDLVLGDLAADAGAGLVIDWKSCWSHGLTPEAKALPWFDGKKTHQVIEQVLRPYALQAFAPAQGVIWIGAQEDYEKTPLFGILQTSLSPEESIQRIALAIEQPIDQTAAWFDPVSKKIVVFLPRYVIRELPMAFSGVGR